MARSAADKAERAADMLEAFLRDPAADAPGPASPMRGSPAAEAPTADSRADAARARAPGLLAGGATSAAAGLPLRLAHTDWLRHRLLVTGAGAQVSAFRDTASGAGTIPWRLDLDSLEEDWFHLLVNPASRSLSLAGARALAGQLRDAVERRHAIAAARVGRSRACPFDLHALVPVPADILRLGPDHPDALAWLWRHWGTTQLLRHVAPDIAGKPWVGHQPNAGEDELRLGFWSADWTPWRALAQIRADWPNLRFAVQPDYATDG